MKTHVIPFDDFMSRDYLVKPTRSMGDFKKVRVKLGANLQTLAIVCWTFAAGLIGTTKVLANEVTNETVPVVATPSSVSIWKEFQEIFGMFNELIMVAGAIALFAGLLTMIFKRKVGEKILITAGVVIGGCFLVPAAVMLVSIIGSMLNEKIMEVFTEFALKSSVKVSN